jgi:ferredoxin-NADP reductase
MTYSYKVSATEIAYNDILLLTLSPHNSVDVVEFEAGQYVALAFRRHGKLSPARCFTIASSPAKREIQVAMRIAGNFTTTATRLKVGDTVKVQGPFGKFVLYENPGPVVMMAGGIGITPFMSMLRYVADYNLNIPITLLYGNRNAVDIPFYDELLELEQRIPSLKIGFLAKNGPVGGRVRSGIIDEKYIARFTAQDYSNALYYLCGPARFMDGMQSMLENHNVDPGLILSESFTQTSKTEVGGRFSTPVLTYGLVFASFVLAATVIMGLDIHKTVESQEAAGVITQTTQTTPNIQTLTPTTDTTTTTTPTTNTAPTNTYTYQRPVSRSS